MADQNTQDQGKQENKAFTAIKPEDKKLSSKNDSRDYASKEGMGSSQGQTKANVTSPINQQDRSVRSGMENQPSQDQKSSTSSQSTGNKRP